jgi:hypothetical protein
MSSIAGSLFVIGSVRFVIFFFTISLIEFDTMDSHHHQRLEGPVRSSAGQDWSLGHKKQTLQPDPVFKDLEQFFLCLLQYVGEILMLVLA